MTSISGRPRAATRREAGRGPRLFFVGLVAVCLAACGPSASELVELRGETMGTTWTVKVVTTTGTTTDPASLREAIEATLDDVDQAMSTWKPDSEVSRLNRAGGGESFSISEATLTVLTTALDVSRRSGGAFDVTVGPLVDAWGFGPPGRPTVAPDEATVAGLSGVVGWEKLSLGQGPPSVTKATAGVQVDLSAIAKGYAVDRVAETLAELGPSRFMVEVGGEVRTAGSNAEGQAWRIAVERPAEHRRELHAVVPLRDLAMATSGDYRNFYEAEGRRLSHTIDPRTGRPIEHRLASVTVVDPSCMVADAWATALAVLGPEGADLAESEGLAALFLVRETDGAFRELTTSRFAALLDAETTPPG